MSKALVVRLRPAGPWRFGSENGARDETGDLFHSDAVFSAVTHALAKLGRLDDWLAATARSAGEPAVRFSSFFPWKAETLFIIPPQIVWPPASANLLGQRGARFLPVTVVRSLLAGEDLDDEAWTVDEASLCLTERAGPGGGIFRTVIRGGIAVDRLQSGSAQPYYTAGIEFAPDAGLWLVAVFASEEATAAWRAPVEAAFRLLADSGFGGRRSAGWGRADAPAFQEVDWPTWLLPPQPAPDLSRPPGEDAETGETPEVAAPLPLAESGYWLLSLYHPGELDAVRWDRGRYTITIRGGRVEGANQWGVAKRRVRMVAEGSVVVADREPVGAAPDLAPDGLEHPAFRYGHPVSVFVPIGAPA